MLFLVHVNLACFGRACADWYGTMYLFSHQHVVNLVGPSHSHVLQIHSNILIHVHVSVPRM
jgi:hypothetical protein